MVGGDMPPLRSSGFVDPGWEHGVAQDEKKKKVKCNYCGKVVSGGIYRLKQHLARVSGEVTYCERAPEEVFLKMRDNLEGCRSSKKPRLAVGDENLYLTFHDDEEDDLDKAGYKRKGKKIMSDKSMIVNLTPLRSLGYIDPGWEHGVAQDERKKKVKCNYCGKVVSGGINRFKQHLARIPGEVAPCKNAPEEVYMKIKDNMKWHRTGRKLRRSDMKDSSYSYMNCENEAEEDDQELDDAQPMSKEPFMNSDKWLAKDIRSASSGMPTGSGSDMYVKKSKLSPDLITTQVSNKLLPYKQTNISSNKKNRKEVVSAICEFFYHAGISFDTADSFYFQKMLELASQYGQGLVGPSSRQIAGQYLQDEISSIRDHIVEYKSSWSVTGCSIIVDSWKNVQARTLINFLVSCPRGIFFVSSVDATDTVESSSNLFHMLDKVVDDLGEDNVVQVITHNSPSYKAAGKMLEEKRRSLFWTPCAAYCIDRILEDFMKIKLVADCMENGQKITKFIYNRNWLLNLMKKEFTEGQELLSPSGTKYAASFATLQALVDNRVGLKRMFQSNKWLLSRYSKSDEAKELERIVLNGTFWKKLQHIRRSVDPVLQILQTVNDNGSLSMPSIYNDMHRAKLTIKNINGDDARKYGPFWSVIDCHWSSLFHHPLCVAAYFLNPAYRYRSDYVANPEVMRGLNECIVRLEPDSARRISASMQIFISPMLSVSQISDFISAKADFGTDLAISTRAELDPAAWWQQHGINCLELQHIAVRILSQTCSSFGCEHKWSFYDEMSRQRPNHLAQKKLNDLLYAHYNLRLRECQLRRSDELMSFDDALLEGLLDDWIDILYNEDGYDYESLDYDDGNVENSRKVSQELATLADIEPLEIHTGAGGATDDDDDDDDEDDDDDDDADLDFLDDDNTEPDVLRSLSSNEADTVAVQRQKEH
ncbi:hypothetical protein V2J09_021116 [Rumex salicifolius]